MRYTVRFAHLAEIPFLKVGEAIQRGEVVGIMGNTGASTGAHLHLDVVEGSQLGRYNLSDIARGQPVPSPRQAVLFVDEELFRIKPVVTTHYADPEYYQKFAKLHCGFDLVPEDRHAGKEHHTIYWNRSGVGKVGKVMVGDPGYGNCIQIVFDA